MAEKVTFTCDSCGQPASEWVRIFRHELLHAMRRDAHDLKEIDLCPKCAAELDEWIGTHTGLADVQVD